MKKNKFNPGDEVEILCIGHNVHPVATVLYYYPRPEESHLVMVERATRKNDRIYRRCYHEDFLKHVPRQTKSIEVIKAAGLRSNESLWSRLRRLWRHFLSDKY